MHNRSPTRVTQPLEHSYQQPARRVRLNHQDVEIEPHAHLMPLMSIETTMPDDNYAEPAHALEAHHLDDLSDTDLRHRLSNQSW